MFGIDWNKIWREKGTESILLLPVSIVYAGAWVIYQLIYWLGIKKQQRPHAPVVCIGNLISGGAGKTPVTISVAKTLLELGHEVVVSVSGYGSPGQRAASMAPDGQLDAGEWGDEAALMREKLPDLPLIIGRDRVRAAQMCRDLHPNAVLLLDDGFQHLPLYKDVTILLDPEELTNRWCMPSGPYREPRSTGRMRADTVLPGQFRVSSPLISLRHVSGIEDDMEKGVNALCAVARPERFIESLESHGFKIVDERLLPDHDDLRERDLFAGMDLNLPLIVTEKDWMKLRKRGDLIATSVYVAAYDVMIEPRDAFRNWLKDRLDAVKR